jgi:hypothetical protein
MTKTDSNHIPVVGDDPGSCRMLTRGSGLNGGAPEKAATVELGLETCPASGLGAYFVNPTSPSPMRPRDSSLTWPDAEVKGA